MDQQLLHDLSKTWPETADYLKRVGQVQNDLLVLQEEAARESHTPSWMDELGIETSDLLRVPTAVSVMRFLYENRIIVPTARQIPEYQEDQEMLEQARAEGDSLHLDVLEDPQYLLSEASDLRMWALPELQMKLMEWAAETAKRFDPLLGKPNLSQSTILHMVARFLDQDQNRSPEFQAECWRSVLSSEYYAKAGNPPQENSQT